jgi:hypothetical protein
LLIDFRRIDFGQELAFFYVAPDIYIPAFQVTVRAGVNRGVSICLDISGENDFLGRSGAFGLHHGDRGHRHTCGFLPQSGSCLDARQNTENYQQNRGYHEERRFFFGLGRPESAAPISLKRPLSFSTFIRTPETYENIDDYI